MRVCAGERVRNAEVEIVLLNDKDIRTLNKDFLSHDYATDVISFLLDDKGITGEIYVSVDTARRQAQEFGVTLHNELQRYVAHGMLHLVGYDDNTESKRAWMHTLENRYINMK